MRTACRICGDKSVEEFFDFGRQPLSNSFIAGDPPHEEFEFRLAVGVCGNCAMAQQIEAAPRDRVFGEEYPYRSSGPAGSRAHFARAAESLIAAELSGPDPFLMEVGCNDGVLLRRIRDAGIRHLGVDPALRAAESARAEGIDVEVGLFDAALGARVRAERGPADAVFSANTISHIPRIDAIFAGADAVLKPGGVFVFEDRYLCDIIKNTYFDQVYDAHFYLFSVRSVRSMVRTFGFELVDVEHVPVHGGSLRYTVARAGERTPRPAVERQAAWEEAEGFTGTRVYHEFGARVREVCTELAGLLRDLRAQGKSVVGYGATAKSATVTNYCGIGTDLIPFICDSTAEKQGTVTPGSHIPVRSPESFRAPYPDYALLFAWTHAEEIIAKESAFRAAGGRWIVYVPRLRVV